MSDDQDVYPLDQKINEILFNKINFQETHGDESFRVIEMNKSQLRQLSEVHPMVHSALDEVWVEDYKYWTVKVSGSKAVKLSRLDEKYSKKCYNGGKLSSIR